MNSLVLFVGLLIVAFSNGFTSSENKRLPIHRSSRYAKDLFDDVNATVTDVNVTNVNVTVTDVNATFPDVNTTVPGVTDVNVTVTDMTVTEVTVTEDTVTEDTVTEDTVTDVIVTDVNVTDVNVTVPDMNVTVIYTDGHVYINGDSGIAIITFFSVSQNHTIGVNVLEGYTLGDNDYSVNITDSEIDERAFSFNFTIVNENSVYSDGYLGDVIDSIYGWLSLGELDEERY